MKYVLRDQKAELKDYLSEFKSLPLNFETTESLPEKIYRTEVLSHPADLQTCDFSFLFHYQIFPPSILNFFGEWELENRKMEVGDLIVQQINIPPGTFSLKLIFAVRILSVYWDNHKVGFSYGALEGHPETGKNEFSFFREGDSLIAQVATQAKPGLFLSKILAPLFTWHYVAYCNQRALQLMKEQFLRTNL